MRQAEQPQINPKNEKIIEDLDKGRFQELEGKHIVIIGGKIFKLPRDADKSAKFVEELEKKYKEVPTLMYVEPKDLTYTL